MAARTRASRIPLASIWVETMDVRRLSQSSRDGALAGEQARNPGARRAETPSSAKKPPPSGGPPPPPPPILGSPNCPAARRFFMRRAPAGILLLGLGLLLIA